MSKLRRGKNCSSVCLPDSYYIIRDYDSGMSCKKIADRYGYDPQAVNLLLRKMGLMRNTRYRQKLIDHHWLDSIDSEVKAYFLGLVAADGWINKNTVFLALKESDSAILYQIVKEAFPFVPVHTYNSSHQGAEKQCRIHITSKHWIQALNKIGITTAKSLTMGDVTSNIPANVRHHFVRGYFDGDGSICHSFYAGKKHVLISIRGTRDFLSGLHAATGIPVGGIYPKDGEGIKSLSITGKCRMFQMKEYLYRDATLFFERKKERFTW